MAGYLVTTPDTGAAARRWRHLWPAITGPAQPWSGPGPAVPPAGCRSVDVTSGGLRLLQDLRRSFATYDKRLLDAVQAAGLPIDAPG